MKETGTDVTDQNIIEAMQREIEELEAENRLNYLNSVAGQKKVIELEAQLDAEKAGGKMVFIRYESIVQKLEAQLAAVRAVPHEIRKLLPKLDVKSWGIITQAIRAAIGEGE